MRRSVLAAAFGAAILLASCSSAAPKAVSSRTTVAPTTPAPTTPPPTTVWSPTAAQPSPDAAAARLVSAWSTGDRNLAAAVASPSAIATLFAQPYPAGYLQARGCTQGANPGTCTYRNTKTNAIYQIQVTLGSTGWYVSEVIPET